MKHARYVRALQSYHGAINTNNHIESMNRFMKEVFKRRHDRRLDSLIQILLAVIIPFYKRKYETANRTSYRWVN
jgi:hypothetical protein